MKGAQQKFPAGERKTESISILAVGEQNDTDSLRRILPQTGWRLLICDCVQEAERRLASERCPIVVCDTTLRDGDWRDVLRAAEQRECPPMVLVASLHADEFLWGEVLRLGGYDVLRKPFDRSEVTRVLSTAWRQWSAGMTRTAFA